MMTSSNGNVFRVTGCLCGEFTVNYPTKSSDVELWCFLWAFDVFLCAWINGLVTNRDASDLRRHLTHYDVTVMCGVFGDIRNKLLYILYVFTVLQIITCVERRPIHVPPIITIVTNYIYFEALLHNYANKRVLAPILCPDVLTIIIVGGQIFAVSKYMTSPKHNMKTRYSFIILCLWRHWLYNCALDNSNRDPRHDCKLKFKMQLFIRITQFPAHNFHHGLLHWYEITVDCYN